MPFFLAATLFVIGVLVPSVGFPFWATLVAAAAAGALLTQWKGPKFAALAIFVLIGTVHYNLDDYRWRSGVSELAGRTEARGIVVTDPERGENSQTFYVKTPDGKISIRTKLYPEYFYGDELSVSGALEPPPRDSYGKHLAKERVHATLFYPAIERVSSDKGNVVMAAAFRFKNGIRESYRKILTYEQAALLSGMTLSANEDLPPEFSEKLSLSGTRHLTAVSGLHMAIVIAIVWVALAYFLPKRWAFALTFVAVGFFAAMTGFKVSAVRAALMGFIAWSGKEMINRPHAAHNSLALAAAALVAANPKVLVFDVGFRLSFLATAAIIYLAPALKAAIRWGDKSGFLGWRESFLVTASAQLAVAPVLITTFQNFSLTSFAANLLILPAVPFVMTLGFLMAGADMLFEPLGRLVALAVFPLLEYAIFVINSFATLAVGFNPPLGLAGAMVYYGVLIFALWRFYKIKA